MIIWQAISDLCGLSDYSVFTTSLFPNIKSSGPCTAFFDSERIAGTSIEVQRALHLLVIWDAVFSALLICNRHCCFYFSVFTIKGARFRC